MMMNYQTTPRSSRPKGSAVNRVLQFALFAVFSLWLLYQIRQPNNGTQFTNGRISNFLGRKGSAGLLKSTLGLTLEDVTNPGEEGEIPRYSKQVDEVEFHQTESLNEEIDNNTLVKANEDATLTMRKSNISFPDENGIPQDVRDKFIGKESSKSVNKTRVKIQGVIDTRFGNGINGTVKES